MQTEFHRGKAGGYPMLWQITGKSLQAADQVGPATQVAITKTTIRGPENKLSVLPISVNIYRFPVKLHAE